jgi:hypothetical protein
MFVPHRKHIVSTLQFNALYRFVKMTKEYNYHNSAYYPKSKSNLFYDRRSVCPGIRPPSGTRDQSFFLAHGICLQTAAMDNV